MSQTFHIALNDKTHKVVIPTDGQPTKGQPTVDGIPIPVTIAQLQPGILSLILTHPDGTTQSFRCIADPDPETPAVLIDNHRIPYTLSDPRSLRATSASATGATGPKPLKAPMPGRIVRILVAPGDTVQAGQGCIVIEAMKMQNELKSPKAGTISKLSASIGDTVPANATLLIVD